MIDHYLTAEGDIRLIENPEDGKPIRVFKPIASFGTITVYEEYHPQPPEAPVYQVDYCDC